MGCLLSEGVPVQVFYSFHFGKMDAATNIRKQALKISQYHIQVNVLIANNKKYYVIFM